jgi:tripartite-type tricarboxylate transporter receptor subunit TctC
MAGHEGENAMLSRRVVAGAVALALGLGAQAAADEPYPNRPVRMLAGAAPGGNPDVFGRLLAPRFAEALGQPFVVENMPGAGGVVAANVVAKAPPDGHVLMLNDSGALAIGPSLNSGAAYDPLKDLTPITALAALPTALVVPASLPVNSLQDFVDLIRKEPHKYNYGSAGPGSIHQLTHAIFAERAGLDMLHVPYRGGSPMVQALLTGEIHAGWSGIPNVLPHMESGKLKALCLSVPERLPNLPNLPTCHELGYTGFDVATVLGLQGPAGMPAKVVATLQGIVAKVLREPAMAARMVQLGVIMQENGTAHYRQYVKDDLDRFAPVVKRINLQAK